MSDIRKRCYFGKIIQDRGALPYEQEPVLFSGNGRRYDVRISPESLCNPKPHQRRGRGNSTKSILFSENGGSRKKELITRREYRFGFLEVLPIPGVVVHVSASDLTSDISQLADPDVVSYTVDPSGKLPWGVGAALSRGLARVVGQDGNTVYCTSCAESNFPTTYAEQKTERTKIEGITLADVLSEELKARIYNMAGVKPQEPSFPNSFFIGKTGKEAEELLCLREEYYENGKIPLRVASLIEEGYLKVTADLGDGVLIGPTPAFFEDVPGNEIPISHLPEHETERVMRLLNGEPVLDIGRQAIMDTEEFGGYDILNPKEPRPSQKTV